MVELLKNNQRFYHFSSKDICNEFITNNNIQISHYCCNGMGFSIWSDEPSIKRIDEIIYTMNNRNYIRSKIKKRTIDDNCCVCLEKSERLTNCGHILCNDCNNSLIVNKCPYCRTQLVYNKN